MLTSTWFLDCNASNAHLMAQEYFRVGNDVPSLDEVDRFLMELSSTELTRFKLLLLSEHRKKPFNIPSWKALNYTL